MYKKTVSAGIHRYIRHDTIQHFINQLHIFQIDTTRCETVFLILYKNSQVVRTAQFIVIKSIITGQSSKVQLSYIGYTGPYLHNHTKILFHIRHISTCTFRKTVFRLEMVAVRIDTYKVYISTGR